MPPLSDDEYAALKADITERGVLVPVVVDQHGHVLDGHHRQRIAAEQGIDYPVEVCHVADDERARDVAFTLNLARRHLTREQKRELIARELARRPGDSDRAIARRLGCSPTTVGTLRLSKLDTLPAPLTRADAESCTETLRGHLAHLDVQIMAALVGGCPRAELVRVLTPSDMPREVLDACWLIVQPRIDGVYAFPSSGHYREVALDVITWPEWSDGADG